jgi:hypothetical protein
MSVDLPEPDGPMIGDELVLPMTTSLPGARAPPRRHVVVALEVPGDDHRVPGMSAGSMAIRSAVSLRLRSQGPSDQRLELRLGAE